MVGPECGYLVTNQQGLKLGSREQDRLKKKKTELHKVQIFKLGGGDLMASKLQSLFLDEVMGLNSFLLKKTEECCLLDCSSFASHSPTVTFIVENAFQTLVQISLISTSICLTFIHIRLILLNRKTLIFFLRHFSYLCNIGFHSRVWVLGFGLQLCHMFCAALLCFTHPLTGVCFKFLFCQGSGYCAFCNSSQRNVCMKFTQRYW